MENACVPTFYYHNKSVHEELEDHENFAYIEVYGHDDIYHSQR